MNFKKNCKRFFNMSRRADGFTLVELIVVIAILAILATIAVPQYSKYVAISQKNADRTLANEMGHAMLLHYYDNISDENKGGYTGLSYVILDTEGASASDEFAANAMVEAFGDDWAENKLQFDGWTAKFSNSAADGDYADVADSTFVKNVGTGQLMKDVQNCTNGLTSFLNTAVGDVNAAKNILSNKLGSNFDTIMTNANFGEGELTADALANATVFAVADWTKTNSETATQYFTDVSAWQNFQVTSDVYAMASWYAASESMVNYLDPTGTSESAKLMKEITAAGEAGNLTTLNGKVKELQASLDTLAESNPTGVMAYFGLDAEGNPVAGGGQANKDASAYLNMMGTVSDNKGEFTTADQLKNPDLVTSGGVASTMNSYVAGAQLQGAMAGMSDADKAKIEAALSGNSAIVYLVRSGNTIAAAVDMSAG